MVLQNCKERSTTLVAGSRPDKEDREEGWRKVDVVVDLLLLFATVSESQIESGGGRERGACSLSLSARKDRDS